MAVFNGKTILFSPKLTELETADIYIQGVMQSRISLKGIGDVEVDNETYSLNPDEYTTFISKKAICKIYDASKITEIDVHGNMIFKLLFNGGSQIEKVVCYSNGISALDVSKLHNLKYLHMHGNPITNNQAALKATFDGLPDRKDKPFGSIVFAPWNGLYTWIEEDSNTLREGYTGFVKYPYSISNLSAVVNSGAQPTFDKVVPYTPVNGNYYRVHKGSGIDPICRYNGSTVTMDTTKTNLEVWRKSFETSLLPKHWLFGSAIQYHADFAKCPWQWKAMRIHDYWDTAEHGRGIRLAQYDGIGKYLLGESDANETVSACVYLGSDDTTWIADMTRATAASTNTNYRHGNGCASLIIDNGKNGSAFGVAPEVEIMRLSMYDSTGTNQGNAYTRHKAPEIAKKLGADVFTTSQALNGDYTYPFGNILSGIVDDVLCVISGGNTGDGLDSTIEGDIDYATGTGTQKFYNGANLDRRGKAAFNSSSRIRNGFTEANFQAKNVTDSTALYDLTHPDSKNVISAFGTSVKLFNSNDSVYEYNSGSSYATPICAALVCLAEVIYKKISGANTIGGWDSSLAFRQWFESMCNPLAESLPDAVGIGMFMPTEYFNSQSPYATTASLETADGFKAVYQMFDENYGAPRLNTFWKLSIFGNLIDIFDNTHFPKSKCDLIINVSTGYNSGATKIWKIPVQTILTSTTRYDLCKWTDSAGKETYLTFNDTSASNSKPLRLVDIDGSTKGRHHVSHLLVYTNKTGGMIQNNPDNRTHFIVALAETDTELRIYFNGIYVGYWIKDADFGTYADVTTPSYSDTSKAYNHGSIIGLCAQVAQET